MRRSSIAVAVFAALIVLLSSSPASAHATFVGAPGGFPTNTDQTLTMNVPHERDDATYNVDIVVAMATGWTALSCQGKPTWTCSLGTVDGRPVVHFVKAPGSAVAEDETFQFSVRTASTVGSFAFPTVQTYNTGEIVRWIGAAGTSNPAPMLATVPGGTVAPPTPPTTNPDAPPPSTTVVAPPPTTVTVTTAPSTTLTTATASTTASTTPPSTTTPPTTTTIVSTSTAATPSTTTTTAAGSDDGGSTNWPLLAVLVLASGGGLFAVRRHSHSFRRKTK